MNIISDLLLLLGNITTCYYNELKSRNLNFLEPSGPVQACKGTALL